jgi:hypothetical protein
LTVTLIAWSIRPAAASSKRTSPAKIGSPAASAEVKPSGRSAAEQCGLGLFLANAR